MAAKFPEMVVETALGGVDVSDFLPIVKHPDFLRLGEKTQLSFVEKVFVGGRHTRLEHSYHTFHLATELCRSFVDRGFLSAEQAKHVRAATLLHDLGHPPFSHSIENVLGYLHDPKKPRTHNGRTKELILNDLSGPLEEAGLDVGCIIRLVEKEGPLSKIISHKTLGMDKLGYLHLDSLHTGYAAHLPVLPDLFPYYYYSDSSLGIQETRRPQVEAIQSVMHDMYRNVYLHPDVEQYTRFMQKAIEEAAKEGEIGPDEIWDMPEGALVYRLTQSDNPAVRKQMGKYMTNGVMSPRVVMKIRGDNRHVLVPGETMDLAAERLKNPLEMTRLEKKLCRAFELDEDSVYISVAAHANRIVPEDVDLYDGVEKIGSLFRLFPQHYHSLKEKAADFFAIRVYGDGSGPFPDQERVADFITHYLGTSR